MPPFVCPLDHGWWPFKNFQCLLSGLYGIELIVHIDQYIGSKYIWDKCVCDISPFLWWCNRRTKSKFSYCLHHSCMKSTHHSICRYASWPVIPLASFCFVLSWHFEEQNPTSYVWITHNLICWYTMCMHHDVHSSYMPFVLCSHQCSSQILGEVIQSLFMFLPKRKTSFWQCEQGECASE